MHQSALCVQNLDVNTQYSETCMQAFLPQCFATPECSGKPVPRLFEGDHAFVNTVFLMESSCFEMLHSTCSLHALFRGLYENLVKPWEWQWYCLSSVNCEVNPHNSALQVPG